jgi:hypothetical protein
MTQHRRPGRPGLLDTVMRAYVIDGTVDVTDSAVKRRQGTPDLEVLVDVGDDLPPVAVGPSDSDLMTQLTQLAQLHRSGLLNDAEFTAAKARLLGA